MSEESWRNYESAAAVAENGQQAQAGGEQEQREQIAPKRSPEGEQASPAHPMGGASTLQKIRNFSVEFGPRQKDILNFTNQLSIMVRAGISLQSSLESIAERQEKPKFKAIITDLKNRIEAGQSFSQALAEHPQVFSNLYINMVAAAEISGSLSGMLQKLAEYLDGEAETRSQVRGAMVAARHH